MPLIRSKPPEKFTVYYSFVLSVSLFSWQLSIGNHLFHTGFTVFSHSFWKSVFGIRSRKCLTEYLACGSCSFSIPDRWSLLRKIRQESWRFSIPVLPVKAPSDKQNYLFLFFIECFVTIQGRAPSRMYANCQRWI